MAILLWPMKAIWFLVVATFVIVCAFTPPIGWVILAVMAKNRADEEKKEKEKRRNK